MNVAYHLTDNYARITGTSIVSLFENNRDIDEIDVYLIENGLTDKTKNRFEELANKYGRRIFFVPLPDLNGEGYELGLVRIKEKWMFDSYSRLFLDRLLPESVERVIYLDGDTIVLGSLRKLWEIDLDGKCCAACVDCVSEAYYHLFDINLKNRYCNSGLILIDLKKWKEKKIGEQIKKNILKNNGYIFFMEQTVFNVVLQNEIHYLPFKYNVSSLVQVLTYQELMRLRKPLHFYSNKEVNRARENPIIIHMTGFFYIINRAWNEVTNHPDKWRFIKYCEMLGWEEEIIDKDRRSNKTKVIDWIVHVLPKNVMIPIVSLMYNTLRVKKIALISRRIEKRKGKLVV